MCKYIVDLIINISNDEETFMKNKKEETLPKYKKEELTIDDFQQYVLKCLIPKLTQLL